MTAAVEDITKLVESQGITPDTAAQIIEDVDCELEQTRSQEVDEERVLLEKFCRLNARYDAEQERVKAQMRAYIAELDAKKSRLWSVLGMRCEAIAKKMIAGGKTKSVKLAFGTVGFRTKPVAFEVGNDQEVIAWAKANGFFELVKTTESLSKTALNAALVNKEGGTAGEFPPTVREIPAHETFYVK